LTPPPDPESGAPRGIRHRGAMDAFDLEVHGEHRHWSEDGAFMIAQTWYQASTTADFSAMGRPGGGSGFRSRS